MFFYILSPDKVPTVEETVCISHKFKEMNCTFITNTKAAELVAWDVTYSLKLVDLQIMCMTQSIVSAFKSMGAVQQAEMGG